MYPRGRHTNQPRSYHIRTCFLRKAKVPRLLQALQPGVRFEPDLPVEEAEAAKENSQINMRGVTLLAWIALRLAGFIAAAMPVWRAFQRGRFLACADG